MKISINDFFSKYDKIRSFLRIWSHLLKKSLMEKFIFSAVLDECCQAVNAVNAAKLLLKLSWWFSVFSICRSSHPKVLCKKGVLVNFAKFARKHLSQSLLNKFSGLEVFSCEFCKISKNTSGGCFSLWIVSVTVIIPFFSDLFERKKPLLQNFLSKPSFKYPLLQAT